MRRATATPGEYCNNANRRPIIRGFTIVAADQRTLGLLSLSATLGDRYVYLVFRGGCVCTVAARGRHTPRRSVYAKRTAVIVRMGYVVGNGLLCGWNLGATVAGNAEMPATQTVTRPTTVGLSGGRQLALLQKTREAALIMLF